MKRTFVRDRYPQTGSHTGIGLLDRYPVKHPTALHDFFRTRDVLLAGNARVTHQYSDNDTEFMLRGLLRDPVLGMPAIINRELVTQEFVNLRDASAPDGIGGTYTTASNPAGTLVPVGTHAEPSASPSLLSYATAAAHVDDVAVCGLFVVDELDTDGILGVYLRGTAGTDHYRAEVHVADKDFETIDRTSSSDTTDLSDTDISNYLPDDARTYISIGLRYNADDTVIAVVNGDIVLSGTANANAQALTGNAVGVRLSGAAPGTGVILFNAFSVA